MTRRANPYSLRLSYNQTWNNFFFPHNKKEQLDFLEKDKKIRDYFKSLNLDISKIKIDYTRDLINIFVYVLNAVSILGKEGDQQEKILEKIKNFFNNSKIVIRINVIEIKNIYSDAQTIANIVADKLKKRMKHRMVVRETLNNISNERISKGVKIVIKGLIDGNDMAQTKKYFWGKISSNTIDNDINLGIAKAVTSRGTIGVKILLNLGKKLPVKKQIKIKEKDKKVI